MATRKKTKPVNREPDLPTGAQLGEKIEWVAAAISAFLYLALVVYLVGIGLFSPPGAPQLSVVIGEPRRLGGAVLVPFDLTNSGTATAADVVVSASNQTSGGGDVVFAYVPAGSVRRGTMVFRGDKSHTDFQFFVTSFRTP